MGNIERTERERVAIAIYEARVHAAIINGWDAEPEALRERMLKAADAALQASGAVDPSDIVTWLRGRTGAHGGGFTSADDVADAIERQFVGAATTNRGAV